MSPRRPDNSIAEMDYGERRPSGMYRVFDIIAKFATACAFIYAAWVAGQFESKVSGTTILSQREQAESQLRASMFHDLIDPIVGPLKEGERIPLDRERLLVELLTLNFHEHIEFKPLLDDLYKRLATNKSLSREDAGIQRSRLSSVARRVIDRQITVLSVEAEKLGLKGYEPERIYFKNSYPEKTNVVECHWTKETEETEKLPLNGPATPAALTQKVGVKSPDNAYLVEILLSKIDIQNHTCRISLTIKKDPKKPKIVRVKEFTLTEFDFPFTDNTRIDKDHRFSLVIDNFVGIDVSPEEDIAVGTQACDHEHEKVDVPPEKEIIVGLQLVWFPKDFITSRERPLDYSEIRKLLNVD